MKAASVHLEVEGQSPSEVEGGGAHYWRWRHSCA